ncbi:MULTISPECIES: TetR/AcrR family transcriptional regulator [Microbacterium]|uniref:TetR/AcrR family transcriptional regulator n=1 Tax=Microbacterium TaxID=33882 RepID=UPI00217EF4F4|nr:MULTISPECIES: TetR/AcrR family transcriptional regulator [Microbacterium]UWF78025.1 TetR family transcriptional regulator [Microbacterium neungamense]WCM56203.1 TetR family transcriptional regulator [Microbacterium sp. EF45047]
MDSATTPGLRERKKRQTRQRLQATAMAMFDERGFDGVTVTEIAAAADVSPATVFNYFPTKEDLVLHGMAQYREHLVASLRDRPADQSLPAAFRELLRRPGGVLADEDPAGIERLLQARRVIAGSPSLQAREEAQFAAIADDLAALAADGHVEGVLPRFLGAAMAGVLRAVGQEVHRLAVAGRSGSEIADLVIPQGVRAVELLERGLTG